MIRTRALLALATALAVLGGTAACSGVGFAGGPGDSDATVDAKPVIYPLSLRYHGIDTVSDVAYGTDRLQRMDVCLPAGSAPETTATPTAAPAGDDDATPTDAASSGAADSSGEASGSSGSAGSGGSGHAQGSDPSALSEATGATAALSALAGAAAGVDPSAVTEAPNGSRPAIMMIHGGSWSHGDKATAAYHAVCQYFASEGFVTFNVDYRLAPTDPFPAGLDDVRRALDFVFRPATLETYDVDRDRVGVFGGSAGGNLAAMLAVEDHDSPAWADGNRIRAVAELSGPTDLTARSTEPGGVSASFARKQLLYLGCTTYSSCPAARRASPQYRVTSQTAPFFIGHSTEEFIPSWESTRFAAALRGADVPVTLVAVRGTAHSIAQLDQAMSERVIGFYRRTLG